MQSFLAETFTAGRYREAAFGAYEAARTMTQARAIVTAAAIFLAFGSVVVVLWLGAQDVIAGQMTGGALSQFVLFAVFGAGALGQLSEVWNEVSQAAGAAGRIGEIMAVKPRIVAPARADEACEARRAASLLSDDVSFAYPGREDDAVLREVSFRVAPGETVAIVGPSGAGKSTLFQLALRFYDPASGAVTLDGVDISKLDPADLARARSRSCRRTPSSSAPPSPTTSPMARRARPARPSSPPPSRRPRTASSRPCRRATTRSWASVA